MAIFSVFTASFRIFFIIFFLIVIHEFGHCLVAYIFKIPIREVCFSPFGGLSKFDMDFNISIWKEFLILFMGPIFQCIACSLLILLLPSFSSLILFYHYHILYFNLLPIYPLDGGKIVKLFFDFFLPYQKSYQIVFFVSYCVLLSFLFSSLLINNLVMIVYLFFLVFQQQRQIPLFYQKFLLERYLQKYSFKKSRVILDGDSFYRDRKHLIRIGNQYYFEKDFLKEKYHNFEKNH